MDTGLLQFYFGSPTPYTPERPKSKFHIKLMPIYTINIILKIIFSKAPAIRSAMFVYGK